MGRELLCAVHFDGKTVRGKALLELHEIVFRSPALRLKIPVASLKSVSSRDGKLHLKWPEGAAVFELGDQAEKWAQKILHPKSTMEKLGVKPGLVVSAVEMSGHSLATDLRVVAKAFSTSKALAGSDLIFFGAEDSSELSRLAKLAPSLAGAGALWVVYPKGLQEIKEQQVLDAGRKAGLVDVKVVGFSPTHTALKFVRPKAKR